MRVIGVIDLLAGRAVHARAGQRESYAPAGGSVAGWPVQPGNGVALARAYVEHLGLEELYVADLDAILIGQSQDDVVTEIAAIGAPLWLDAGVTSADDGRRAITLGAAHVVVGLETLPSFNALENIAAAVGGDRIAFSLDLREGRPVASGDIPDEAPAALAARAAAAGAGAVMVIDLARVGMRTGLDVELLRRVRKAAPNVVLLAGGGVRGPEDLARLADAGCDGALVATALLDGSLSRQA